jgi:hypothetical protein
MVGVYYTMTRIVTKVKFLQQYSFMLPPISDTIVGLGEIKYSNKSLPACMMKINARL